LGGLLTLLGLLLPATILAIRAVPAWADLAGGQSLPLGTGLVLFVSLLAPFCLVSGYFFPCACLALANSDSGGAPGRVYALETFGAALGVILLQLFLLGRYGGLALSLATGLLLALCPWVLERHQGWQRRGVQLTVALLLASGLYWVTPLEQLARSRQWPGRRVVATADSPYAFLSASREDGQVSFFANNLWQFTYPDPFTAEHQVQLGLLAHPDPRRVLLLGGGVGLVPEILKTCSVFRLDYVELDPRLVELAQGLLPDAGAWLRDSRVRLSHQDARHFVAGSPERYDVILMALPEPRSAQLNRFYSREFFQLVAGKLAPGGVFHFSLTGSETSLHPWRAAYLALAYHTLGQVFPEVLALPGERVQFFGATASGVLAADPELLTARLKNRRLPLQYVREYYLRDDLAPAKVGYLKGVLDRQPAELNTDLTPGCYFYDLALAGIQEGLPIGRVLLALKHLPVYLLWAALGLATLILAAALRSSPGPRCLYQVTVMGLGTMALEILVLILYQIHLGSLYRQLGLLIAVFMAGMGGGAAVGGFLVRGGEGRPDRGRPLGRWLAGLQIMLGLLALSLAMFLIWSPFAASLVPEYLVQGGFALILAVAGFGGGGIFALSAGLWFRERGESGAKKGGLLYAVDLLGSTLGALGFSFFIVPVWGIWPALILVAALHAGAALMLLTGPTG
jgi:spermidine synthase